MTSDDAFRIGQGRTLIDTSRPSKFIEDLESRINQRIIGQLRATKIVSRSLEIYMAGLVEPGMPAAILKFAGPPGVGKTEMAFVLSEELIGKPTRKPGEPVISPATVIDCTFFKSPHDLANLKGSTKGYVGYEDEVPLHQHALDRYAMAVAEEKAVKRYLQKKAEQLSKIGKLKAGQRAGMTPDERKLIRREIASSDEPFLKVLLFDEIARSHSSLWEFLISMMNGKPISISDGTTTDLTGTILIMTSNINEKGIQDIIKGENRGIGFAQSLDDIDPEKRDQLIYTSTVKSIEATFPAPFVSRIKKNIVVFRPFTRDDWMKIIDLRINEVSNLFRIGNPEGRPTLRLRFSPECKQLLLEQGIDPQYGARPLRETVRKYLHVPLARILNDAAVESNDTLIFDREKSKSGKKDDDRIVVYKENPSAPSPR